MSWCLELPDRRCLSVQVLEGSPPIVALWTEEQEVLFYAVEDGAFYGALPVMRPAARANDLPTDDAWWSFLEMLRGPNHAYLSPVSTESEHILCTYDGRLRVYAHESGEVVLDVDHQRMHLLADHGGQPATIALDRDLGTLCALTADGQVHVYQQHVHVHSFPLDRVTRPPLLFHVLDAGTGLVLADRAHVALLDLTGQVIHTRDIPAPTSAPIGAAACSPKGDWIVVIEATSGVVRVYDDQLTPIYQDTIGDLLDRADPIQLWTPAVPDAASARVAAITDDGTLVLALDSLVCRVYVEELTPLPRARRLL